MITDAILAVIRTVVSFVVGLFPPWPGFDLATPIAGIFTAIAPHLWFFAWADEYIPLTEALLMLAALVAIWLGAHVVTLTIWLLSKLHVLGGGSK
jgi:hypothetical protein